MGSPTWTSRAFLLHLSVPDWSTSAIFAASPTPSGVPSCDTSKPRSIAGKRACQQLDSRARCAQRSSAETTSAGDMQAKCTSTTRGGVHQACPTTHQCPRVARVGRPHCRKMRVLPTLASKAIMRTVSPEHQWTTPPFSPEDCDQTHPLARHAALRCSVRE